MKVYLLVLFIFVGTCHSAPIQAGGVNPIMISNPNAKENQSFTFSFKLGAMSKGLVQNQFLAVVFPAKDGADVLGTANLKFHEASKATCTLYRSDGVLIATTFQKSDAGQENVCYCKITDITTALAAGASYRLTIAMTANTQMPKAMFLRNFGMFTATSSTYTATKQAQIIDTAYSFGNGCIYGEKTATTRENIKIKEVKKMLSNAVATTQTTLPYESYDVRLLIEFAQLIRTPGLILAFNFPSSAATIPTKVSWAQVEADVALKAQPKGTPAIKRSGAMQVFVDGFNATDGWFGVGRQFYLNLNGAVADRAVALSNNIELLAYYGNSNVIQSYGKATYLSFGTHAGTLTYKHPEGWDVYQSGVWPVEFTYTVTSGDIAPTGGVYNTLVHSKLVPGFQAGFFVASSCDFSGSNAVDATNFKPDFGSAVSCHPLQPGDIGNYGGSVPAWAVGDTNSVAGVDGSGIVWRQVMFKKNIAYKFTVWISFDVCGNGKTFQTSATPAPTNDPLTASGAGVSVQFTFKWTVYATATLTTVPYSFTNQLVQVAGTGSNALLCYSTFRGMSITANGGLGLTFEQYGGKADKTPYYTNEATNDSKIYVNAAKGGILAYKEFTDPSLQIGATGPSASYSNVNLAGNTPGGSEGLTQALGGTDAGYGLAGIAAVRVYPSYFLFSATTGSKAVGLTGGILLRGDFAVTGSSSTQAKVLKAGIQTGIPVNLIRNSTAATTASGIKEMVAFPNTLLQIYISKSWFAAGTKTITDCTIAFHINKSALVYPTNTTKAVTGETPAAITYLGQKPAGGIMPQTGASNAVTNLAAFVADGTTQAATRNSENELLVNYLHKTTFTATAANNVLPASAAIATIKLESKAVTTLFAAATAAAMNPGGINFTIGAYAFGYLQMVPARRALSSGKRNLAVAKPATKTEYLCGTASKACSYAFFIWTDCLKYAAPTTNKNIWNYFDLVLRFSPSKGASGDTATAVVGNGPDRVIRMVKLFAEHQVFFEAKLRKQATPTTSPFTFHYSGGVLAESGTTYASMGNVCLVEVDKTAVTAAMVTGATGLLFHLVNISLLDSDISSYASTYPVGSIGSAKAYGNNSVYAFSGFGIMGGKNEATAAYANNVSGQTTGKGVGSGLGALYSFGIADAPTTAYVNFTTGDKFLSVNTAGGATDTSGNGRSNYIMMMGSTLTITGIAAGANPVKNTTINANAGNENLFFPTRCPVKPGAGNTLDPVTTKNVFMKMTSFKGTANNAVDVLGIFQTKVANNNSVVFQNTAVLDTAAGAALVKLAFTSNWKAYGSATATDNKTFNYKSATIASGGTTQKCSGYVFFWTSNVTVDDKGVTWGTAAVATDTTVMSLYKAGSTFYAWGSPFTNAAFKSVTSANRDANDHILYGLVRPTALDSWYNTAKTAFTLGNQFGIWCNDGATIQKAWFSNVTVTSKTNITFNISITNTAATTGGSLAIAAEGTNYKDGKAGAVTLTGAFPSAIANVPKYGKVAFSSTIFSGADTICGLGSSTGNVVACAKVGSDMGCELPDTRSGTFTLCCYSVTMVADPAVTSIHALLPGITTSGNNYIYTLTPSPAPAVYAFKNDTTVAQVTTLKPTITTPKYSIMQKGAIGTLSFTVGLQRPAVRDGKITIQGNFAAFVTTNLPAANVNCWASFNANGLGDKWDNGDAFIDYCDITDIGKATNSIIVVTKKIVYKCGKTLSSNLYITLSPVIMGALNKDDLYQVLFQAPGGASASNNLVSNADADKIKFATPPTLDTTKTLAWTAKLCDLEFVDVGPRITNSLVDFTWTFDLSTAANVTALGDTAINQFTVFLPAAQFGMYANGKMNRVYCSNAGKQVPCEFMKPGVLNFSFTGAKSTNAKLTLHNVPIGAFDSLLSFFCTVNNVTSGKTLQLLTGTGVMKDLTTGGMAGIFQKAATASTYNLLHYPSVTTSAGDLKFGTSDVGPGVAAEMNFLVGIDFSDNIGAQDTFTVKTAKVGDVNISVYFHLYLPMEFLGQYYLYDTGYKPTFAIKQWYLDSKNVYVSKDVPTANPVQAGGRLSCEVSADLVVEKTHKFFQITVTGIRNPQALVKQGTSPFNWAIVSTDYATLMRTWTSSHNLITASDFTYNIFPKPTATGVPTVNQLFTKRKGLIVNGEAKWVSTIAGCSFVSGRYTTLTWSVAKTGGQSNDSSDLKTSDANFKFPPGSTYSVKSLDKSVKFMMGTTCTTNAGNYLLSLTSSNTSAFYPIPMCFASLTAGSANLTKVTVAYTAGKASVPAGFLYLAYTVPMATPNVDVINIAWTGNKDNDSTAKCTDVTIPAYNGSMAEVQGQIYITNKAAVKIQKFIYDATKNKNTCWEPSLKATEITASVTGIALAAGDADKWVVVNNPDTDTKNKVLTTLRVTITPTKVPVLVFCAMICKNFAVPTAALIKSKGIAQTKNVSYGKADWEPKSVAKDILFAGLTRGQEYCLHCVFETTEFAAASRTSASVKTCDMPVGTANKTQIMTKKTMATICMVINSDKPMSANIQATLLKFAQYHFSPAKSVNTGCIYVEDNNGKLAPGYTKVANVSCPAQAAPAPTPAPAPMAPRRLRYLTSNTTTTPAPAKSIFQLCAIQQLDCATDYLVARRLRDLTKNGIQSTMDALIKLNTDGKLASSAGVSATDWAALGTVSIATVSDTAAPTVALTFGTGKATYNGNATIAVNYNATGGNSFDCYWSITEGATKPANANAISKCTSTTTCGKVVIQAPGVTFNRALGTNFNVGVEYNIWGTCYNRVPGATKNSAITSWYKFTLSCPTGMTASSGKCITPTPPPQPSPSPSPTTSANFLYMSYIVLGLLMMLI